MKIIVKYHNKNIHKIQKIAIGEWIDLRAAETVEMKRGEFRIISLGVSIKLEGGYEAIIAPRSSTFKKFKIIMANSIGVIDNSYCGENDVWGFPALAVEDTVIHEGDRICQFRVIPSMPPIDFVVVEYMEDESRGGFGSTGVA